MSLESFPTNETRAERIPTRAERVGEIIERVREVTGSVREAVRTYPTVTIGEKNYSFSLEEEPGIIPLAKIQAIKGEVANLAERAANDNDMSAEQAARLLSDALSSLERFFGTLEDARRINPALAKLIDELRTEIEDPSLDDGAGEETGGDEQRGENIPLVA